MAYIQREKAFGLVESEDFEAKPWPNPKIWAWELRQILNVETFMRASAILNEEYGDSMEHRGEASLHHLI